MKKVVIFAETDYKDLRQAVITAQHYLRQLPNDTLIALVGNELREAEKILDREDDE